MHHTTDMITHTTAFVTPVVEHWLEQEIAQSGVTHREPKDRNSSKERKKETYILD